MSEDITSLQLKPYRIQRTYMKTPKYTLSLYIPPAETTVVNNGYNIGVIGILYFQLPWQESKIKRSIEIRVKNQRKILRCLSEALNWFDNIVDLLKIMKENHIKIVPVVDSKNKLKGLITKSSLITSLSQQFLESEEKDGIL